MRNDHEKLAQIQEIVSELIRRHKAGSNVDYAAVEREHPTLMPQLAERLRTLRGIQNAADRASTELKCSPPGDSVIEPDLEFLRQELTGYEILERVHHGGQGIVYKAVQRTTKRTVAIKILLDGPLASIQQQHRFAREVELTSRVRHPNIVTLHESGSVRGRPFFVMEYVDGLPIDDYVLLHALTVHAVVRLARAVTMAVSAAHQHGIIHRDLKPSNILIDSDGDPHVVDFGLAKDAAPAAADNEPLILSITGHVVGTLPYLSPEQASESSDKLDVRSDIYSLGVILFELIAGQYPYPVSGDRQTALSSILTREPMGLRKALADGSPSVSYGVNAVNDDLEKIVLKALEKDKSRRYQSAVAFADDLGRYLAGDAVEAKAASSLYLLKKTIRRFRVHVAIAAAFVGLLVSGLVAVTVLWQRAERVSRIAQAGLQMGSFLKVGSVHRDDGRVDQAIAMFDKALEISEETPSSDPIMQRHRYEALHRLAELYYGSGDSDKGDKYCIEAGQLAEVLVGEHPGEAEWQRLVGFSYILRGRMAYAQEDWEQALNSFKKVAAIRSVLLASDPANSSLKWELALALGWVGKCHRVLRQYPEALEHYVTARTLYQELVETEPRVVDHKIDLSRVEVMIAAWHLFQRTAEHDQTGAEWLQGAEQRLTELRDSGQARPREPEVTTLLNEIGQNQQLVLRRAERRAKPAD